MTDQGWRPPAEFEEYRSVRLLGCGAMGEVYLAFDTLLDRMVAVKFVRGGSGPIARPRVFHEARAIAKLQHPNVVSIYRVGEVDGHAYLVSEYVRGQPLDQLARPAPSPRVLEIALDLARGLAAAHRCGVLHRDVKPANAILASDGHVKLLDFGTAALDRPEDQRAAAPPHARLDLDAHRQLSASETLPAAHGPAVVPPHQSPDPAPELTPAGSVALVGTPLYMAPELWRGEPATRRSDLYALGILLYELLVGHAPHDGVPVALLHGVVGRRDVPRVAEAAPGVDPALAAIVDRLIERDAAARFASADELLLALEECAAPTVSADMPDGNPYRGLAAFDSSHAALFFGRRAEIRELVDLVRSTAFVVVGGDSGTGKSSLCRAGVLPWLVDHDGWSRVDLVPGRRPLHALAAALAAWLGGDEASVLDQLRDAPDAVARAIRQHGTRQPSGGRLLLFVDQLEELLTLAEPAEARSVAAALAALAVRTPSVRVLATARSDFLSRLARLPGLGDELSRGLYFLRPLTTDRLREVVVRPAAARGVRFESDTLVEALVAQTEAEPGGLPLLQFVLAEVWDSSDMASRTIHAASLDALGGVAGALTRHADRVIDGLQPTEREAARRVLLRLVTADGTRGRRLESEIATDDHERAALDALVRSRVVVAVDSAYELAHEALLASWPTLQRWLARDSVAHAVSARAEQAAAEWERVGRARELLWTRRQLAEADGVEHALLGPRAAAFLAASRRAIFRARVVGAGLAVATAALAILIGLVARAHAREELEQVIAAQTTAAATAFADAQQLARQRDAARQRAFELFDSYRWPDGELAWSEAEALAVRETGQFRAAASDIESALALDPARASLRSQLVDILVARLRRAELDRDPALADELRGRLTAYQSADPRALPAAEVPRAPERPPTGAAGRPDMVYIPAGRFLFGSNDTGEIRGFLNAAPLHEVSTGAYYIARHEVTFGQWIAFLDDLPPEDRRRRSPSAVSTQSSLTLTEVAPKRWRLALTPTTRTYTAETGERLHYAHRSRREAPDWSRLPVAAISYDDSVAYTAWLDRTGRIRGARLCDEREWERAARGEDGRTFPGGRGLAPDDANIDVTYGRDPFAFGPDEVGQHPGSRSPYGIDDMAGNVWEWTRSVETPDAPVARGGGWYNAAINARSTNREQGEPTQRHVFMGLRICATPG